MFYTFSQTSYQYVYVILTLYCTFKRSNKAVKKKTNKSDILIKNDVPKKEMDA